MKSPFEVIENIQQKPRQTRQLILAASTAVIMGIILFIWIITLSLGSSSAEAPAEEQPSPFALLWNFIKGGSKQ